MDDDVGDEEALGYHFNISDVNTIFIADILLIIRATDAAFLVLHARGLCAYRVE